MRRVFLILGLGFAGLLALLWASGGYGALLSWALAEQRGVQAGLAGAIRALRGGHPGALLALLAVSFSYGFLHAVGPGHGKVLIGGYGVARQVRLLPLAGIAFAASMAQAVVAVVVVYALVAVLGWTREATEGVADAVIAPLGTLAIAAVGAWLCWRGLRGIWRQGRVAAASGHEHGHEHGPDCGHAHGPDLEAVGRLTGWRDTALLVAGIAMRPCTGALFLLILTWQMGIGPAGIAGAFAMGFGTAVVTVTVAGMAVWAREGVFASLPGARIARALPVVEALAGAVVVVLAIGLLSQGR